MGGAELQVIDEYLPEELLDKLDIKGAPCLDHCNKCDGPKVCSWRLATRLSAKLPWRRW